MRRWMAMVLPMLLAWPAVAKEEAGDALGVENSVEAATDIEGETDIGSGVASYYGRKFAGNPTASGEIFDPKQLTAAHRTLAFGSRVRVTNLANGKSVVVRVNDRGPFSHGRVIDISDAAAREIGMHLSGLADVSITLLDD